MLVACLPTKILYKHTVKYTQLIYTHTVVCGEQIWTDLLHIWMLDNNYNEHTKQVLIILYSDRNIRFTSSRHL